MVHWREININCISVVNDYYMKQTIKRLENMDNIELIKMEAFYNHMNHII